MSACGPLVRRQTEEQREGGRPPSTRHLFWLTPVHRANPTQVRGTVASHPMHIEQTLSANTGPAAYASPGPPCIAPPAPPTLETVHLRCSSCDPTASRVDSGCTSR